MIFWKTTFTKLSLSALFFMVFSATHSQEKPREWTLYSSENGVEIFYKYADCISNQGTDQERVILKFNNTNNFAVSIEWKTNIYYNGKCHNCNSDDHEFVSKQKILRESSIEGNCEDRSSRLSFYSDFLDYEAKQKLTNFELVNVSVTKQKSTK